MNYLLGFFKNIFSEGAAPITIIIGGVLLMGILLTFGKAQSNAAKVGGKWYKQHFAAFTLGLTLALIAVLWTVSEQYRPYNPKKDGVPKVQTDTTRQAAEEMIKK